MSRNVVIYGGELYHHGIKGQKHGIRNGPPYPLRKVEGIRIPRSIKGVASTGLKVTGISDHAKDQMADPTRMVEATSIVDAFKNPLVVKTVRTDSVGRKSQQFVGRLATIAINPETGMISTVWPTHTKTRRKYEEKSRNRRVKQ